MMDAAILPVSRCGTNASVRVSSNLFPARIFHIGVIDLGLLMRQAPKYRQTGFR
jgi:hypothetical protein